MAVFTAPTFTAQPDYTLTPSAIDPRSMVYADDPVLQQGYFFVATRGWVVLYRASYATSTAFTEVARFEGHISTRSADFHFNGSNSYLFVGGGTANVTYFYRINPATVSGDRLISAATATFQASSNANVLKFWHNGATSLLFFSNGSSVGLYRFDPATVSGTVTTASVAATFDGNGTNALSLVVKENGSNLALAFSISSNVRLFLFNPATVSGSQTFTAQFSIGSTTNTCDIFFNGSNSLLAGGQSIGTTDILLFRFNPSTVSGIISASTAVATVQGDTTGGEIVFQPSGANLLLLQASSFGRIFCYKLNPSTVSGTLDSSTRIQTFFSESGSQNLLFANTYTATRKILAASSTSADKVSLYVGTLDESIADLTTVNDVPFAELTDALVKPAGQPLQLTGALTAAEAFLRLKAGVNKISLGFGLLDFGWDVVFADDSTATINEDLVFTTALSGIAGEYRITMGSGASLFLFDKGSIYSDKFTIASGATLVLAGDTELSSDFIVQPGATIRADNLTGPYEVTIPYSVSGVTLGTGITVIAPTLSLTLTNLPIGSEVRIYDLDNPGQGQLGTELAGIENTTGTTFVYADASPGNTIWVQVLAAGFREYGQEIVIGTASSQFRVVLEPEEL